MLKTKLPEPSGTIPLQKGYRARPIEMTIKSFEKGTSEPKRKKTMGKILGFAKQKEQNYCKFFPIANGTTLRPLKPKKYDVAPPAMTPAAAATPKKSGFKPPLASITK